jgi:hypothetical protein
VNQQSKQKQKLKNLFRVSMSNGWDNLLPITSIISSAISSHISTKTHKMQFCTVK